MEKLVKTEIVEMPSNNNLLELAAVKIEVEKIKREVTHEMNVIGEYYTSSSKSFLSSFDLILTYYIQNGHPNFATHQLQMPILIYNDWFGACSIALQQLNITITDDIGIHLSIGVSTRVSIAEIECAIRNAMNWAYYLSTAIRSINGNLANEVNKRNKVLKSTLACLVKQNAKLPGFYDCPTPHDKRQLANTPLERFIFIHHRNFYNILFH